MLVRYVELENLVGQLKRSVIDLYMREEGWRIRDGDYYVEDRSRAFGDGPRLCFRPDEWGFRGGEVYDQASDTPPENPEGRAIRDSRYIVKFDDIRRQVEEIVEPWYDLPSPALIGGAAAAYGTVVNNLCRGTNENITGEGTLGPNMTRIWDDLIGHEEEGGYYRPALSGEALDTFKEYVRNLDRAIGGCAGVAQSLEKCVLVQQQLWAAVPSNVSKIVGCIAVICNDIVEQKSSSQGFDLDSVELFLDIASEAPGPVGVVATGGSVVVTIIGSVKPDNVQQTVKIENFEDALDTLDKLLNKSLHGFGVNEMVETFERQTGLGITQNIQEINAQRGKFDLTPGMIETVDKVIRHSKTKVDNIYRRLSSVSVELGNVAYQLSGCVGEIEPMMCTRYGSGILARDSRVGISRNGPTDPIVTLTDLLRMTLAELSGEVEAGAGNFKAAMDVLDRTNSQTRSALAAAAQAYGLSDQGGIDSFDFHPWTAAGLVESSARMALDTTTRALGLDRSNGGEQDAGAYPAPQPVPGPRVDSWLSNHAGELLKPEGETSPTDQPWCYAEPRDQDDGEVVIRSQPQER